jgi:hypothetical protein
VCVKVVVRKILAVVITLNNARPNSLRYVVMTAFNGCPKNSHKTDLWQPQISRSTLS